MVSMAPTTGAELAEKPENVRAPPLAPLPRPGPARARGARPRGLLPLRARPDADPLWAQLSFEEAASVPTAGLAAMAALTRAGGVGYHNTTGARRAVLVLAPPTPAPPPRAPCRSLNC